MSKREGGKRGKGSKSKTAWDWEFFPIYGLSVLADDGLASPLWGDATIVGRDKIVELVKARGASDEPRSLALLTHGRLSDALDQASLAHIGNPESRMEIVPHSYIAVKRRNDIELSARRAEEVRAMMTATMFLRGSKNTAFCGAPHEFAWYVAPRNLTLRRGLPPQASIAPKVNPYIVQKPLQVQKSKLRESVSAGSAVTPEIPQWDLFAEHPVCLLLNNAKPNRLQLRLIRVARQLQRAACTPSNPIRLQLAVAAWETLFNSDSFPDLQNRMEPFFRDDTRVEGILKARHALTHESFSPLESDFEKSSGDAVALGWILLDVGVAASENMSASKFDEYTSAQSDALRLDSVIQRLAGIAESSGVLAAFHGKLNGKLGRFTGRAHER